eukprot:scaffold28305_cov27-Tisochrysis_lutea.AAC.6
MMCMPHVVSRLLSIQAHADASTPTNQQGARVRDGSPNMMAYEDRQADERHDNAANNNRAAAGRRPPHSLSLRRHQHDFDLPR